MKRSLIAAGATMLAITGAIALTATGAFAGDAVINACAQKHGGALRTIAAGKTCKKSERAISWSRQGPAGKDGTNGKDGTAVAYAHVLSDGMLDTANSRNVSASSRLTTGEYCYTATVRVHNGVASVDSVGSGGAFGFASVGIGGSFVATNCPAGSTGFVGTSATSGANSDRAFYLNLN